MRNVIVSIKFKGGHERSTIIKGRMVCVSRQHLGIVVKERRHFPSRISAIHILRFIILFVIGILGRGTLRAFLICESHLFLVVLLLLSSAFWLRTVLRVPKKIKLKGMDLLFWNFFFRKFLIFWFLLLFSILFLYLVLRLVVFTNLLERLVR